VADHLTGEEVAGIKDAFELMDTGKRGKITLDELRIGLQKLGHQIPDAELQILMDAVSTYSLIDLNVLFGLVNIWSSWSFMIWMFSSLDIGNEKPERRET